MDARSLIGSALRGPLRATLREALRFVGANLPVRCRLRSISLRCYVMARSAVLSADTRRLRAAPLARSLPLPICRLRASPCRAEGAKGAPPPYQVCCPLAVLLKQNRMRRPSLPEAARARLRPSVGLLSRNAIGGAVPANPGVRSGRRQGHRLVCPNRKVKTNHPDILAVRVNPGARNGRSRGRLTLSPNRKVKTPVAGCGAVPANPGDRSGRRRGQRLIRPIRKVKTNPPDILAVPANSGDRSGRRRGRLNLSPNRKVKTPIAFGVAVPANPDTRSARRRGHRRVWPNRKIKTLAAGRKTPAPQPDFRQPSVTVSWPKRPLTGQAATTTVPSRQWPQTRACDTGIVAIVVDP